MSRVCLAKLNPGTLLRVPHPVSFKRSRKELRGTASALEKAKKAGEDTLERQEEYKRESYAFRKQVRKDKQVHADTLNKSLAELSSDPILSEDLWNKILTMAPKMTQNSLRKILSSATLKEQRGHRPKEPG